jgi:hypothetical protein
MIALVDYPVSSVEEEIIMLSEVTIEVNEISQRV